VGDRAYCQVQIAERDREKLEPIFDQWGFSIQEEDCDPVCFEDSEANYGGSECLTELRGEGFPFYGYHDAGGNYGAEVFACDGTTYAECPGLDGEPFCRIADDGEPEANGLEAARQYLTVLKAAKALVDAAGEVPNA
jgi:hypothetical protein